MPRFSDRELSDFLLRACHDLKAPVRAMRAHAELLARRAETPAAPAHAESLGFVVEGARKMDLLLDRLTSYSIALQIDPESFQATSLGLVVRTALARLNQEIHARGAEVSYAGLPTVQANPDRLIELFEHLLRNSLQHSGAPSPRIHITAEERSDDWVLAVRDNGPALDAAYLERMFKPFEHGPGRAAGAGMGLAISAIIVEKHGGKIWAETQPGQSATVYFTLPA